MSAGISNPGVIDRDEMIDVNLTPVFLVTQAVLRKGAKKKGGRITPWA
jgi:NAD(P)-dependent dehydrogenase (short-subunit alcohol dehydrogenase family)